MKSATPLREERLRTPMILQMEAVECGAASLAIILAHHGRFVPLATLRRDCGVSRDGSNVSNLLKAAQAHGLIAKAYKMDLSALQDAPYPYIVHWRFNHFVVVEGYRRGRVYLNDPASGPHWVPLDEFDACFTGIVLTFQPGPDFRRRGSRPSVVLSLWERLRGSLIPVFAAIATALLLVIPGLAIPALVTAFVDKVLVEGLRDWGRPLVLGMLLAALLRGWLSAIQLGVLRRLQIRLAVAESSRFVQHLLQLPASYYAQRYAGEVSSRIALNDHVAELLSGRLATTAIDVLMMFFYLAVMWYFNRSLAVVAAAFAMLNFCVLRWIALRRAAAVVRHSVIEGRTAGVAISGLQSIRTLKASGLESDFFARWAGFYANFHQVNQELGAANHCLGVLPPLLTFLMTAVVLAVGGFEVIHGAMSIGMLVAFQSLAASFLLPVNSLVALGASMQELEGDLSRLDDVLSSPASPEPALAGEPALPTRLTGRVEFRNVTFGYSPVTPPILQDLSFTALPGQRIAIVGPSGSGKSTLAKLLCGLYAPLSGEILFDGIPAATIPREILSNSLALVDQEIVLFKGSVRENLTLWDASLPAESLKHACRDALIGDVIDALPEGYSSELLEGGANLSGGQRQRLEIARALAADPAILILDEATSALDADTESLIDRRIRSRGCTCVIVAHRLSTVRDSDEIIVLERGRVVQRGTHDQLMLQGGLYRTLVGDSDLLEAGAGVA